MVFLEKFDQVNRRLSFLVEWVGLAGLILMMIITFVDVIGAKVFQAPLLGAIDLVMISQLMAVSFALAGSVILGRHVEVEFFVPLLPTSLQKIITSIVHFMGLFLFVIICWQLFKYGYFLQSGEEVSPTLRIPLYPFAYGAGLACIPVFLIYLNKFIQSIMGIVKK